MVNRCRGLLFLCAITVASVWLTKPAFADGTLTELDNHQIWFGPITELHSIGPNQWQGHWHNNHSENRTLNIQLYPDSSTLDIWEVEPNQHWVGPYYKSGATYLNWPGEKWSLSVYIYYGS